MVKNKFLIIVALLFTIGVYYFGISNFDIEKYENQKIDSLGTLGDFIGGNLNPILAFLSFLALLTTIKLQSEEMAASRDELKRSAQAQEDSKKILDQQYNSQVIQQFENTFFSLLEQIKTCTPSANHIDYLINESFTPKQDILEARKIFTNKNELHSHYFRLIYQTLKFLDKKTNHQTFIDIDFYKNILRSTLTPKTTLLLGLNSAIAPKFLKTDDHKYYKELIEKYNFLQHMPFRAGPSDIYLNNNYAAIQMLGCYEIKAFDGNKYLKYLLKENPNLLDQIKKSLV